MKMSKFRRIWILIRRSAWYPAIAALLPNFIISLAWSYGATGGIVGFVANFIAIEGLVILILIVARPAMKAEALFEKSGYLEVDTPDARILVGKIKAEAPSPEYAERWAEAFPKLKDAWVGLLHESEKALHADTVTPDGLVAIADTLAMASAQIRAGHPFDIDSLKKAACYLGHSEAQGVSQVRVINRIRPVLWFTPDMAIYFLDLFRHASKHPLRPQFVRISIFEDEEWRRANDREWRITNDIDPLKAFIAINQMAGISLKGLTQERFSKAVERYIVKNEARIQSIDGTETGGLKEFIRNMAFLMYCEGDQPIKVFRGRPYAPPAIESHHTEPVIMWPEITNAEERKLYFDLFTVLDGVASPLQPVNVAQHDW